MKTPTFRILRLVNKTFDLYEVIEKGIEDFENANFLAAEYSRMDRGTTYKLDVDMSSDDIVFIGEDGKLFTKELI